MRQREPIQVRTDGLPVIASGVHGTVYLYDEERILKLYNPEVSRETVEKERAMAREAFIIGVPTSIPYEVAVCGSRYGIIFEKIRSDSLGHLISSRPDMMEQYAAQYAALARTLHGIHTQRPVFPELKAELERRLPRLAPFCTEADMRLLEDLITRIPDADSLIHGDLHPGNIMVQDGELLLIDMPEMMRGSPKWDLAAIYRDMVIGPMQPSEELEKSIGMKAPLIARTGRAFFRAYTGMEGEKLEKYMDALLPLFGMNTVFTLGAAEDRNGEACARIIPMLMAEAVRKHEDELRAMLAENETQGD